MKTYTSAKQDDPKIQQVRTVYYLFAYMKVATTNYNALDLRLIT
jgi:hypothetical protein